MYDFATKKWEPLLNVPFAALDSMILAISDTEILIGQGMNHAIGYERRTFVFDIVTKDYTPVGDVPTVDGNGMHGFRCGLTKGSLVAICMGGTSPTGVTKRFKRRNRNRPNKHSVLTNIACILLCFSFCPESNALT